MAVKVDYYDVLNIPQTATEEEILEAVKKQMRQWRKRTEAPDLGVRQEAELRVKRIEEARATLTDSNQRTAYDARLKKEGVEKETTRQDSGAGDLLEKARHYLSIGDYYSASYAAREATQQYGNSAESWYLRSRANAGIDRYEDAWYESQQAIDIEPNNAEYHFNSGMIAEEMGQYGRAIKAYQAASTIDSSVMYEVAIGNVYLELGEMERAVDLLKRTYENNPGDEMATFYYAVAMHTAAEAIPEVQDGESYLITSKEEIEAMRGYVDRIKALPNLDPDLLKSTERMEAHLDTLLKRRFDKNAVFALGDLGADMGCLGLIAVCFIPAIPPALLIGAFGAGDPLFILIAIALLVIEFYVFFKPGWKINRNVAKR
ncbi:J domain-containing protein [Corynebacterium meridianum]|uniref:DnaJ domain-containing protein n=1 Tax=Corynebacterium meridianum TaxID=2765363 RepID=A0A934HYA8_9CORY|nr:tetratricopeptide repeat protein [Corynebacterium meridianum]MBI8988827.1 DnaJ domain-containing protein [Corynebacterium meridianum]MCK7676477.1 DnaJ domain-containing protein [Corynebacterium meridianum]